jgi:hypothetical protein
MNWPNGSLTDEEKVVLEAKAEAGYDSMRLDEKLAYIFSRFGKIEAPNEDNTSLKQADKKIADANTENEKVFEMMWYVTKEDALLKAVCKIWQRYYEKRGLIRKFENKVYKMRKHQEWLVKQEEKKKKHAAWKAKQSKYRNY